MTVKWEKAKQASGPEWWLGTVDDAVVCSAWKTKVGWRTSVSGFVDATCKTREEAIKHANKLYAERQGLLVEGER